MKETLCLPLSIESQGIVYGDPIRTIERVQADFGRFTKDYYVSDHGQRAAVVAVVDGRVLLTRQYRLLINRLSLEVPGGGVESGETGAVAAARECLEETGVRCHDMRPLISYQAGLDVWKNYTQVFVSENCEEVVDAEHAAQRVWMPVQECIEAVFTQKIQDSLSVIGLLAYNARRDSFARSS